MCVCVLFFHSSDSGNLGCFHFLDIVNDAAMNLGTQMPATVSAFSCFRSIPQSRISGSCGSSGLTFLRNCQTFPQWLQHFIFPPAKHEGSNVSTSSLTPVNFLVSFLILFFFLHNSHPNRCDVKGCFFSVLILYLQVFIVGYPCPSSAYNSRRLFMF